MDSNTNIVLSYTFSIISILFYSVVYYPQFYVIYKTKNTDGISVWMLLLWGQSDFLSLIGTVLLSLEISLVGIGWYHAIIGFLMTIYVLFYDTGDTSIEENKKENQKQRLIKITSSIIFYAINFTACLYLTITKLQNFDAGTIIGWITSILYIIGRFPQIFLNIKRKSTEGLSILMYVFTICGNTCYLLAVLTFSIEPEYININMPWIVMVVVTVLLDFVVIFQSFYYKTHSKIELIDNEQNCLNNSSNNC